MGVFHQTLDIHMILFSEFAVPTPNDFTEPVLQQLITLIGFLDKDPMSTIYLLHG